MLGLMGFSGSLPLYVIHRYYIFVFIDRANKDACLLACTRPWRNDAIQSSADPQTPNLSCRRRSKILTTEHKYKIVCDLSNSTIFSDLEMTHNPDFKGTHYLTLKLRSTFNDTEFREASVRQLSSLLFTLCNKNIVIK